MREIKLYGQEEKATILPYKNWSAANALSIRMDYISRSMTRDIISLRAVMDDAISRFDEEEKRAS